MSKHTYTYLALGDSYTIGEGVALHESFPYQVVQIVRDHGVLIHAPEIIAKTGWTTFELAEQVLHTKLQSQYDFVTLAIGVNNQYRNLPVPDYGHDFEFLLKKALHFAGEQPEKVIVLSIPDWSVTPFAQDRDRKKIATEIDQFNRLNQQIAAAQQVPYLNITMGSVKAGTNPEMTTNDKLHPSGREYARWAVEVAAVMLQQVVRST